PSYQDWKTIADKRELPPDVSRRSGELIADFYSYNTAAREQAVESRTVPLWRFPLPQAYRPPADIPPGPPLGEQPPASALGEHWVDDLAVECVAEVTGSQGALSLMVFRAGIKHVCEINLADGRAKMTMVDSSGQAISFVGDDGKTVEQPTAQTTVKGAGRYRLRLSNCDHEMLLWMNGTV